MGEKSLTRREVLKLGLLGLVLEEVGCSNHTSIINPLETNEKTKEILEQKSIPNFELALPETPISLADRWQEQHNQEGYFISYRLGHSDPTTVQKILKELFPEGVTVTYQDSTNLLMIRVKPEKSSLVKLVEDTVKKLDTATPQVRLDIEVTSISAEAVERINSKVSLRSRGEKGLYPVLSSILFGGMDTLEKLPKSSYGVFELSKMMELSAEIDYLTTHGYGQEVIKTTMVVGNKGTGKISSSTDMPLEEMVISTGATSKSPVFKTIAPTMIELTPIIKEGYIELNIKGGVGALRQIGPRKEDYRLYREEVSLTNVAIPQGGGFCIAGFTRSTEQGVERGGPFGEIPFIGRLFKGSSKEEEKTILIYRVTPRSLA